MGGRGGKGGRGGTGNWESVAPIVGTPSSDFAPATEALYARASPATLPVGGTATLSRRARGSGRAGRLFARERSAPSLGGVGESADPELERCNSGMGEVDAPETCGCGGRGRRGDTGKVREDGRGGTGSLGSGTEGRGAKADLPKDGCATDILLFIAGLEGRPTTRMERGRRGAGVGESEARPSGTEGSRRAMRDGESAAGESACGVTGETIGGVGRGGLALTVPDRARERGEGEEADASTGGDGTLT